MMTSHYKASFNKTGSLKASHLKAGFRNRPKLATEAGYHKASLKKTGHKRASRLQAGHVEAPLI
jgi:hypothetical protein